MNIEMLRLRRYKNMSINDLDKLNGKLIGRGHNWVTLERQQVCEEYGNKMANFFINKKKPI